LVIWGLTDIVFIEVTLDDCFYCEVLKQRLLPDLDKHDQRFNLKTDYVGMPPEKNRQKFQNLPN